jgi:hypothetical protein
LAKRERRSASGALRTTAENLGAAFGSVAARLDSWKKQRDELAADIQRLMKSAQGMLGSIGDVEIGTVVPAGAKNKGGRPKGYKMSAASKAKLRAAWKKRKAAMHKNAAKA